MTEGGLSGGRAGVGADAAVLAFLPLSCGRHPPGVWPGSVFMRVKFARREVPGRICGGGCSCDPKPGPMSP